MTPWRRLRLGRIYDLSRLDRRERAEAKEALAEGNEGFRHKLFADVVGAGRVQLVTDSRFGASHYAFFPWTSRAWFPFMPPGWAIGMGALVSTTLASLWHELGHLAVDGILAPAERAELGTRLCSHQPRHDWFYPSSQGQVNPRYSDGVGEAAAHGFQFAFAPRYGSGPSGWPHDWRSTEVRSWLRARLGPG